jgi:hypothetical protein
MFSRPRPDSRVAAPWRALLALATTAAAWLVVVTHLTTALHFALISHEICAAHGELVHGSNAVHARVSSGASTRENAAALPAGDEEGHEHCPVLSRRYEHTAVLAAPSVRMASAALERVAVITQRDGIAPSRCRLLLAAPKQSPPV